MGKMDEVLNGLFVGGLTAAHSNELLHLNNITHIYSVTCCSVLSSRLPNITTKCVPIVDSSQQDILQLISSTNDFIHQARLQNGAVLVHCMSGVSRSVSLVCAYIMSWCGLSAQDALAVIKYNRPCADPNNGFRQQLVNFHHNNQKEEENRLKNTYGLNMLEADILWCKESLQKFGRA